MPTDTFCTKYEINETLEWVRCHNFTKVALQFPESLLSDSTEIFEVLSQKCPSVKFFICADSTYSSCCVDFVVARHLNADAVVHYGPACLSSTSEEPVFYVFGREMLNAQHLFSVAEAALDPQKRLAVYLELPYTHLYSDVLTAFAPKFPSVIVSHIRQSPTAVGAATPEPSRPEGTVDDPEAVPGGPSKPEAVTAAGGQSTPTAAAGGVSDSTVADASRTEVSRGSTTDQPAVHHAHTRAWVGADGPAAAPPVADDGSEWQVLYVGSDEQERVLFTMTHPSLPIFTCPSDQGPCEPQRLDGNVAIRRRYVMMFKVKDAERIGILVGTTGVKGYLEALKKIKATIKAAGKQPYLFVVGKINPAKLANFADMDVFVMVACAQSTLIESKEFYQPIVTPYELHIALTKGAEWTGDYVLDFQTVLPGMLALQDPSTIGTGDDDNDEAAGSRFSFLSGGMKAISVSDSDATTTTDVVVAEPASQYLATRSYQGLVVGLGQTPVATIEKGRSGIASTYENEPKRTDG